MKNVLTVDVESTRGLKIFLNLLDEYEQKATFFILGALAAKDFEIVKTIAEMGYEMGCHGFSHIEICRLREKRFREEVKRATYEVHKASGISPIGFRAPRFSINKRTAWALNILKRLRYKYDSSIFPA